MLSLYYIVYTTDNSTVTIKQFIDESLLLIFITFFMYSECEKSCLNV